MNESEARDYIRLKMREKLVPERTAYECLHEILMEELMHKQLTPSGKLRAVEPKGGIKL